MEQVISFLEELAQHNYKEWFDVHKGEYLHGAAALGDIGSHFPDTDPKWKGADSTLLLERVVDEVAAAGYAIGNVDATVICERPRLRPHVDAIRARLAELLHVDISRVSVKGKTNEKMDDVGAGKGIVVHAAVLLKESESTQGFFA